MNYAVDIGSGAMVFMPGFIETGSGSQKLIWRDAHTYREDGAFLFLFFFKIREVG